MEDLKATIAVLQGQLEEKTRLLNEYEAAKEAKNKKVNLNIRLLVC